MTDGSAILGEAAEAGGVDLKERLPDLGDAFGGGGLMDDGFGLGDGGMMNLGDLPNVSDLNLDPQTSRAVESKERGVFMCSVFRYLT